MNIFVSKFFWICVNVKDGMSVNSERFFKFFGNFFLCIFNIIFKLCLYVCFDIYFFIIGVVVFVVWFIVIFFFVIGFYILFFSCLSIGCIVKSDKNNVSLISIWFGGKFIILSFWCVIFRMIIK